MKPVVLIPVYNHEHAIGAVVDQVRAAGLPVLLVDDGSQPSCAGVLDTLSQSPGVSLFRRTENGGKGAAVMSGLAEAQRQGFTHAIQIDADGQHALSDLPRFLEAASSHPDALVTGVPQYDASVPKGRLYGRYLTHIWVWINTLSLAIKDSMCGFRVYPLARTLSAIVPSIGKRMDFDPGDRRAAGVGGHGGDQPPHEGDVPHRRGEPLRRALGQRAHLGHAHPALLRDALAPAEAVVAEAHEAMSAPRETHWANVAEGGFAAGMWLLYLIQRYLGRWPFRVALAPVLLFYVAKNKVARDASREYFQRLGIAPGFRTTFRHIGAFAESLMDKAMAVSGRFPFDKLRFTGREVMLESLAQGRGGLLVTAHMGCLEVCRLAAERKDGPKLNVLVHTQNAERFNAILQRLDPHSQVKLLQVTEFSPATAALLAQKVDAGEFVVIAADRVPLSDAAGRTVPATFLGQTAWFPVGPWVLASALKCQVILFTVLHEDDTYRVRFERLAEQVELPRGRREEAAVGYVQQYAQKLEQRCHESPYDWFNFFPFWEPPRA